MADSDVIFQRAVMARDVSPSTLDYLRYLEQRRKGNFVPTPAKKMEPLEMARDLVLLTGSTGYLGYLTLLELLRSGYSVRAAVRSADKAAQLREAPSLKALAPSPSQLSFIVVPDMAVEGVYDAAARGAKFIVHIASPIPSFGAGIAPTGSAALEAALVKPAAAGTLGVLRAARAAGTVRRVVLTSSTVAIVPVELMLGQRSDLVATRIFTPTDRVVPVPGPPYSSEFEAYCAGKAAALNTVDDFVRDASPGFDVVNILPSWIFGTDERVTTAEGMRVGSTNSVLLNLLLGRKGEYGNTGNAVKGSDVALAHVRALEAEKVPGNRSFVLSRDITWDEAVPIAKRLRPEAFADGKLCEDGSQVTIPVRWDTSESEAALGISVASFDSMIEEVVDQYLWTLTRKPFEN